MTTTLNCFLIDNDAEDAEIFTLALQEVDETISCSFACNGIQALKQLSDDETFTPSIIFIDMNMPLMNGLECIKELRQIHRLNDVNIYMYSTGGDPMLARQAKDSGATDFIEKPSSFTKLKQLLTKIV